MSQSKNYSYSPIVTVHKPWFPIYLFPYVCLDCQKAFRYQQSDQQKICPQCKADLIMLSRKFKTPKKNDHKEWAKIKYLIEHGFRFSGYVKVEQGSSQKVKYPETMQQAYEFVDKYKNDVWEC